MFSIKRNALIASLAGATLLASTLAALAAPAYATSNVNVRSGPGTGYGAVDVLHRGESVDVDYCRGAWCFVDKAGPNGWVNASYLSRDGGYRDDYYDDYDDDYFYIERPRHRIHQDYWYGRPSTSACVGGPNAQFCVYD